ncbi:hypothetical protein [Pseudomonas aeruginosa]|uniref:hypothetical protein n=1 Tax=Pseudomonas aeruginosa TaxID=287 RepID=UPI0033066297
MKLLKPSVIGTHSNAFPITSLGGSSMGFGHRPAMVKTGKTAGTGRQSRPIHGYAEATFLLSITRRSKATYANPRGRRILQGEWEKHGACNFASASEYFSTRPAFRRPFLTRKPATRQELLQWLKEKNPSLADKEIQINGNEFYVCYDVNFTPMSCHRWSNAR